MEDAKSWAEAVTAERKRSCRLYPSLPQTDRHEVSEAQGAAALRLHGRSTDAKAEADDSVVRLKAQVLVLEEQQKQLLLINERWAREYRTMTHFYKEKLRSTLKGKREARGKDEVDKEESTEAPRGALPPDAAAHETLQDVWKHQAEVYREDFLKERSDREKIHGKYLDLEKKYKKACRELRVLKPQAPPPKPVVDCRCRNHGRPQNPTDRPPHEPVCALNLMHL